MNKRVLKVTHVKHVLRMKQYHVPDSAYFWAGIRENASHGG